MWAIVMKLIKYVIEGGVSGFMVSAGLTLVTYTGISLLAESALNIVSQHVSDMPAVMLDFALMSGIGKALNIIGSAILTRLAVLNAAKALHISKKSS